MVCTYNYALVWSHLPYSFTTETAVCISSYSWCFFCVFFYCWWPFLPGSCSVHVKHTACAHAIIHVAVGIQMTSWMLLLKALLSFTCFAQCLVYMQFLLILPPSLSHIYLTLCYFLAQRKCDIPVYRVIGCNCAVRLLENVYWNCVLLLHKNMELIYTVSQKMRQL